MRKRKMEREDAEKEKERWEEGVRKTREAG